MKKDKIIPVRIKTHKDKTGGHPHIIVEDIEDKHVSVGLSTKPKKGKNNPNYALKSSPLCDGKTSYMRRQGTVAPQKEYYGERKGRMTQKDYRQAKVYADNAKQKYLVKKNNKKK